jgi:O-antigen/teichoic acid export membrane protein
VTAVLAPVRRDGRVRGLLVGNVAARLGALGALAVATVLVARAGGPSLVGAFTLLRVLPGLAGVLAAAGLPGAAPYFLASHADDPRLRPTLVMLTWVGACAAGLGWLVLTPVLYRVFFHTWRYELVMAASFAAFSQLFVAVGKALLQGSGDMRGANVAIVAEEAAYLPVYIALLPSGHGVGTLLLALVAADVMVACGIAERLRRSGFFRGWGRMDLRLARDVTWYGARGQVGGLLTLLNLRFDVAILGALAGPAVLGVYAIATKYVDLLRLPGLAVNYVLYPRFARARPGDARARTRAMLPAAAGLNALAAIPLALAAGVLLPAVYGRAFHGAVVPAWILLVGAIGAGVTGLIGAYLYGIGKPGLNSMAIGVGVVVALVGDLLLIPRHGAVGAATASSVSSLVTVGVLLVCFAAVRPDRAAEVRS